MSNVDKRVVQMEFDNASFEKGVAQTLASMKALNTAIDDASYSRGLSSFLGDTKLGHMFSVVEEGGKRVAGVLSTVGGAFGTLGKIAGGVLAGINTGLIGMAIAGGKRRALNIEQAKFQLQGLGIAWKDVEKSINDAVSGTRFGLDSAAKAASQLAASNVQLGDDMSTALRAISGVASMTNAEYDDIAQVFTRVAGNGRVMAQDLLSISSRGLNAAAAVAKYLNEVEGASGATEADVREFVKEGELSFDRFAKAMNWAFGDQAMKANDTFTGALSNMKAALSRIGAQFFVTDDNNELRGGLEYMRQIFTTLIPMINLVAELMKPVSKAFLDFSGVMKDHVISVLENIMFLFGNFTKNEDVKGGMWKLVDPDNGQVERLTELSKWLIYIFHAIGDAIGSYIEPFRNAIHNVFSDLESPADTLLRIAKRIHAVVKTLTLSKEQVELLSTVLTGVFTVIKMVAGAIGGALWFALDLLGGMLFKVVNAFKGLSWIFDNVLSGSIKVVSSVIDGISRCFERFLQTFSQMTNIKTDAIEHITSAFEDLRFMIVSAGPQEGVKRLSKAFGDLASSADELAKSEPDSRIAAIWKAIAEGLRFVQGKIDSFIKFVQDLSSGNLNPVADFFDGVVDSVNKFFDLGLNSQGYGWLKHLVDTIANFAARNVFKLIDDLKGVLLAISDLGGKIKPVFESIRDYMSSSVAKLIDDIAKAFQRFFDVFKNRPATVEDFIELFDRVVQAFKDFGGRMIEPARNAIENMKTAFWNFASSIENSRLMDIVHKLSEKFEEISQSGTIVGDVINGIKDAFEKLGGISIKDVFDSISGKLAPFIESFKSFGSGVDLGAILGNPIEAIGNAIGSIGGADASPVISVLSGIADALSTFVGSSFYGLLDAAADGICTFMDAMVGVVESVKDFINFDSILDMFQRIGDVLSDMFETFSKEGFSVEGLIDALSQIVGILAEWAQPYIGTAVDAIGSFIGIMQEFGGNLLTPIQEFFEGFGKFFGKDGIFSTTFFTDPDQISDPVEAVGKAFSLFGDGLSKSAIGPSLEETSDGLGGFATGIEKYFPVIASCLGGLIILFQAFRAGKAIRDVGKGLQRAGEGVANVMDAISKQLGGDTTADDKVVKRIDAVKGIIEALVKLAAAVVILGTMKIEDLAKGIGAIAVLGLIMVGIEKLMAMMVTVKEGSGKTMNAKDMQVLAFNLILIAASMAVLAVAVRMLGSLELDQWIRGLGGVVILLGALTGFAAIMSRIKGTLEQASKGILIISVALIVLYGAIRLYQRLEWDQLADGLLKIGAALLPFVIVSFAMKSTGEAFGKAAPGFIAMAASLLIMYAAIKLYKNMDLMEIALAVGNIVVAMIPLILMSHLMQGAEKGFGAAAASMIVVALGLIVLAGAIKIMSTIDIPSMITATLMLVVALAAMTAAIFVLASVFSTKGVDIKIMEVAAALGVLALALMGIAGVIVALSLVDAGKGVLALVSILAVITALTAIMALTGLGAVFEALSAGMAAFGVGLLAMSVAMAIFAAVAPAATLALISSLQLLLDALPGLIDSLLVALESLVQSLLTGFIRLMANLGTMIATAFNDAFSGVGEDAGKDVSDDLSSGLKEGAKSVSEGAGDLILGFLSGIGSKIQEIAAKGVEIVGGFLDGIGQSIGQVIDSGVKLIGQFLDGMARALRDEGNQRSLIDSVGELVMSLISFILEALATLVEKIPGFGPGIAEQLRGLKNDIAPAMEEVSTSIEEKAEESKDAVSETFGEIGNLSYEEFLDSGITEIPGVSQETLDEVLEIAKSQGVPLQDAFAQLGEKSDTFVDKLDEMKQGTDQKMTETTGVLKSGIGKAADIAGAGGASVTSSLATGMDSKVRDVYNAAQSAKANAKVSPPGLFQTGWNLISGLASGMSAIVWKVQAIANKVASIVDATIRKKNEISSPSRRLATTGKFLIQGLVVGIASQEDALAYEAERIADIPAKYLSSVGSVLDDYLNSPDFNAQPVVRPVFDGSEIAAGMDGLFGQPAMVSAVGAVSGNADVQARLFGDSRLSSGPTINYNTTFDYKAGDDAWALFNDFLMLVQMHENAKGGR